MAQSSNTVAILIGAAVIGGAIYVAASRKKQATEKPSAEVPPEALPPPNVGEPDEAPSWVPTDLATRYETCYDGQWACSDAQLNQVLADMLALSTTVLSDPQKLSDLGYYYNELVRVASERGQAVWQPFRFAPQNIVQQPLYRTRGRHVGRCACEERQREVGEEACCESCAHGGPCEECGH